MFPTNMLHSHVFENLLFFAKDYNCQRRQDYSTVIKLGSYATCRCLWAETVGLLEPPPASTARSGSGSAASPHPGAWGSTARTGGRSTHPGAWRSSSTARTGGRSTRRSSPPSSGPRAAAASLSSNTLIFLHFFLLDQLNTITFTFHC